MNTNPPKRYQQIKAKYPDIIEKYEQLSDATKNIGVLTPREIMLVKLGISIGTNHLSNIRSQVRKALMEDITSAEMHQAAFLATTTIGFSKMMAALSAIDEVLEER